MSAPRTSTRASSSHPARAAERDLRAERGGDATAVIAITALCCALSWLVLLHPGFMSPDSAHQLSQARGGVLTDWHAPLMSILWMATDRIVPGPFGMLVLQTAILWTGLALLARRIAAPAWAKVCFLLSLAVAPPVLSIAGALWKDVLMAALATLAFAVADRRRAFWPVALLATMSRHNAIPAVAVAVLLHLAPERVDGRALARAALASALLFATALGFNALVVDEQTHPEQVFLIGDFIGISVTTQTIPSVDACHKKAATPQRRRALPFDDDPKTKAVLVAAATQFKYCADEAASRSLLERWMSLVAEHPAAYLHVRSRLARQLLGIDEAPGNFMLVRSIYDPVRFGLEPPPAPSTFQEWLGAELWRWRDALVFRPWLYGVLGIAAAVIAALRRRRAPLFIALSGLASECGLFLVAPSADYRYSYWLIVSALIATLWTCAEAVGALVVTARARRSENKGLTPIGGR